MDEGVAPAGAFELLAAEPRMDVLRALAAARREGATPLSFSALRRRTDIDDSGRFNYHLGKLVGTFVEKTESGYDLTYAGRSIVAAVTAGTYTGTERKGPEPLADDCVLCGAAVTARYADGELAVRCANDHGLFVTGFPPGAAADMELSTLLETASLRTYQRIEFATTGRCPECFGSLVTTPATQEVEGDRIHVLRSNCEQCGERFTASAGTYLVLAPEVVAFYREHGVDVHHARPWTVAVGVDGRGVEGTGTAEASVVSEHPYRLRFDLTVAGDRLSVTLDDRGRVVATGLTGSEQKRRSADR
jgi:hypothetical protein